MHVRGFLLQRELSDQQAHLERLCQELRNNSANLNAIQTATLKQQIHALQTNIEAAHTYDDPYKYQNTQREVTIQEVMEVALEALEILEQNGIHMCTISVLNYRATVLLYGPFCLLLFASVYLFMYVCMMNLFIFPMVKCVCMVTAMICVNYGPFSMIFVAVVMIMNNMMI